MKISPPRFRTGAEVWYADNCTSLRDAVAEERLTMKALVHSHYPGEPLSPKVLPGLLSVGYWNAEKEQNWGLDWHRNEGLELSFLRSGTLHFQTVDSARSLVPGDLSLCGPWQLHRLGGPNISPGILQWIILDQKVRAGGHRWTWPSWIVLSQDDLDELARILLYNRTSVLPSSPSMTRCWDRMFRCVRDCEKNSHVSHVAVLINEILLALLELLRTPGGMTEEETAGGGSESLRIVRIFLNEFRNIPRQLEHPWSVAEMARTCGMSESRFTRLCRRLTNLSPISYLNQCRITHAVHLLQHCPEQSVTRVALECGFSSSQYFSTVFRKWAGTPPSDYRLRHRQDSDRDNSDHNGNNEKKRQRRPEPRTFHTP